MTFTLDLTAQNDLTDIRMHIGDVEEDAAIFSDEHINYVLNVESTVSATVIALIQQIIAKLSRQPDMTADWLRIDYRRSSEYWTKLLAEKRSKFGVSARTAGVVVPYRGDTLQTEAPDWD